MRNVPIFMNRKDKSNVSKELFKRNVRQTVAANVRSIDETTSFYRNLGKALTVHNLTTL